MPRRPTAWAPRPCCSDRRWLGVYEEHADLLPVYRIDVAGVGVPGARRPGLPNRPLPVGCTGVLARVRREFGRSHRGDVLGEEIEAINDIGKDPKDPDNEQGR